MKIGLFGGSFDPPHRAHRAIAEAALNQFALDSVFWIPASLSPFKQSSETIASGKDRIEMVRLICESNPRFSVSAYEVNKGGVSYSADTYRYFKSQFPEAEFFWILGEDALSGIARWRDAEFLMNELTFLVAGRGMPGGEARSRCKVLPIDLSWDAVASRDIKASLAGGAAAAGLDENVAAYIKANHLYGAAA